MVEGKENDCQKETTARIKKIPPAVFNFIDEQLWQSLPSVDWKWLKVKKMIVKKECTASIKNPPAVFNFIDEHLWQSLPSVD